MVIDYLDIILGTACNKRCPYCIQSQTSTPANSKADPVEFAVKFLQYCSDNQLERIPTMIQYWGGEPMLYFKQIQTIHDILFNSNFIAAKSSKIATNGLLINEEYVDWANRFRDIRTSISLHNQEFTDDQIELFGRLKNVTFTEVINHENISFEKLEKTFNRLSKFFASPIITPVFIHSTDLAFVNLFLTFSDVDNIITQIQNLRGEFGSMVRQTIRKSLLSWKRLNPSNNYCVNADRLTIDLHGNRYQCHHMFADETITENIFDTRTIRIHDEGKLKDWSKYYESPKCSECEYKLYCRGYCPISHNHEVDCYLMRKLCNCIFEN